jgi:hypothetical protein
VDDSENDPDTCYRANFGTEVLAAVCSVRQLPLLAFSLGDCGQARAEAERHVCRLCEGALVVRIAVSPDDLPELIHASLDLLIDGERGLWHLAVQGVGAILIVCP